MNFLGDLKQFSNYQMKKYILPIIHLTNNYISIKNLQNFIIHIAEMISILYLNIPFLNTFLFIYKMNF